MPGLNSKAVSNYCWKGTRGLWSCGVLTGSAAAASSTVAALRVTVLLQCQASVSGISGHLLFCLMCNLLEAIQRSLDCETQTFGCSLPAQPLGMSGCLLHIWASDDQQSQYSKWVDFAGNFFFNMMTVDLLPQSLNLQAKPQYTWMIFATYSSPTRVIYLKPQENLAPAAMRRPFPRIQLTWRAEFLRGQCFCSHVVCRGMERQKQKDDRRVKQKTKDKRHEKKAKKAKDKEHKKDIRMSGWQSAIICSNTIWTVVDPVAWCKALISVLWGQGEEAKTGGRLHFCTRRSGNDVGGTGLQDWFNLKPALPTYTTHFKSLCKECGEPMNHDNPTCYNSTRTGWKPRFWMVFRNKKCVCRWTARETRCEWWRPASVGSRRLCGRRTEQRFGRWGVPECFVGQVC